MILCTDSHQKQDTSGPHKFIRKHEIAGFWKVAGGDESDSAVEGDDAGSLVEEVHAARATPVGVDTGPGRSITVDLSYLEKDRVASDAPKGPPNEIVENRGWTAVNAHNESNSTMAETTTAPDCTTADASRPSRESSTAVLGAHPGAVDSGTEEGAAGIRDTEGIMVAAAERGSRPHLDEPAGSTSAAMQGTSQATDTPMEGEVACRTSEAGPAASGYDMMDLDTPGNQVGMQLPVGASTDIAGVHRAGSQQHRSPHPSKDGGSCEGNDWPEITPQQVRLRDSVVKRMLIDWEWIWQR
jgi:hypothetical protein